LEITGCIVTIDAIGIQTEIMDTVVADGGNHLLAVKESQGHLVEDVQYLYEVDMAYDIETTHRLTAVSKGQ
jgi:predicted transposase YbfD/YdcC